MKTHRVGEGPVFWVQNQDQNNIHYDLSAAMLVGRYGVFVFK